MQNLRIEPVNPACNFHTRASVLRLDLVHPVISGNKWFKLEKYLAEAVSEGRKNILTYGGAFSNHIVATAAACAKAGLRSIGIIRGERPADLSPTLRDALEYGMELVFVSREDYREKKVPRMVLEQYGDGLYIIDEGGYGVAGAEGVAAMLASMPTSGFTHLVAAVGTGTTLAGMAMACGQHQRAIGISVLKNNSSLQPAVEALLTDRDKTKFSLVQDYHFGGYAKKTAELIAFMNRWYERTGIASDFVYTGKLFYAVNDMTGRGYFSEQDHLLIIHSGGLQGNRSLPKGTLIF